MPLPAVVAGRLLVEEMVNYPPPLWFPLLFEEKDDEELMYTFCYWEFDCALLP